LVRIAKKQNEGPIAETETKTTETPHFAEPEYIKYQLFAAHLGGLYLSF
tara:strand:- start:1647 stop:1793 length:147 start_codon:yes stop_codon:yes gene_type:complete